METAWRTSNMQNEYCGFRIRQDSMQETEREIEILINAMTAERSFGFNCDSHSCPSRIWLNLSFIRCCKI